MFFKINSDSLRPAARLFKRLKITTAKLPILQHLLVSVEGRTLTIVGTNLDVWISRRFTLQETGLNGCFCLPAEELLGAAAKADKDSIITVNVVAPNRSTMLDLVRKRLAARNTFKALDPEDFPTPPATGHRAYGLPAATVHAIRAVAPFTSNDQTRYVINGVFLDPDKGGTVVGTDGRRLGYVKARAPHQAAILPNVAVDILADAAFDDSPFRWEADEGGSYATLAFGPLRLTSKLIEGNYPNYHQVIPPADQRTGSISLPAKLIPGVLDWLRDGGTHSAKLRVDDRQVTFLRDVRDKGASQLSIPAAIIDSPPDYIMFNGSFLREVLAAGLLTLDLIDEMSPGIATDGHLRCVIMPMRMDAGSPPAEDDEPDDEEAEEIGDDPEDDEAPEPEAHDDGDAVDVEAEVIEEEPATA